MSGRVLGLNGQPISDIEPDKMSGSKPGWDKRTKKELQVIDEGRRILAEMADHCVKLIGKYHGDEKKLQNLLDTNEREWIKACAQLNAQSIQLNRKHIAFNKGRQPKLFIPKALEIAIKIALEPPSG